MKEQVCEVNFNVYKHDYLELWHVTIPRGVLKSAVFTFLDSRRRAQYVETVGHRGRERP